MNNIVEMLRNPVKQADVITSEIATSRGKKSAHTLLFKKKAGAAALALCMSASWGLEPIWFETSPASEIVKNATKARDDAEKRHMWTKQLYEWEADLRHRNQIDTNIENLKETEQALKNAQRELDDTLAQARANQQDTDNKKLNKTAKIQAEEATTSSPWKHKEAPQSNRWEPFTDKVSDSTDDGAKNLDSNPTLNDFSGGNNASNHTKDEAQQKTADGTLNKTLTQTPPPSEESKEVPLFNYMKAYITSFFDYFSTKDEETGGEADSGAIPRPSNASLEVEVKIPSGEIYASSQSYLVDTSRHVREVAVNQLR